MLFSRHGTQFQWISSFSHTCLPKAQALRLDLKSSDIIPRDPTVLQTSRCMEMKKNPKHLSKTGCSRCAVLCRLQIQYRMHPCISFLPAQLFYDGMLLDGVDAEDRASVMHEPVRYPHLQPFSKWIALF